LRDLDENGGVEIEEADDCRESLTAYLDYLEKMYVGHQSRYGWSLPRYPPQLWNQVENALNGGQLSTNCNEGYHSRLREAVKHNSSLWALISELIDVEAECRAKCEEDRAVVDYCHEDDESEDEQDDGEPQPGGSRTPPGCGTRFQRKQKRLWLKNVILRREEYGKVAYLKSVAHIEPY
jgi:hypothetical protein